MSFHGIDPVRFGSVSNVTATPGSNDPEIGTTTNYQGNEYIYVYNKGTSDINPGYGAIVSGSTGYSVTVSAVASHGIAIGICKHTTFTTGTYGWLLTKGFCNFENGEASTGVGKGENLYMEADGGWANASGITLPAFGQAMEAVASAASGLGYFRF